MKNILKDNIHLLEEHEGYVSLKELCMARYADRPLVVPIGNGKKDDVYMNLEKVHGLFIGGTTGSGKSVFLDTIIVTLMLKNKPSDIKFLFLDPKKIELGEYDGSKYINNKTRKNISSSRYGFSALIDLLTFLGERNNELKRNNVKNIKEYNKISKEKWPHIFIVVDESCDLMQIDGAEEVITKILDYGKPLGVHVLLATNSYLKRFYKTKFIDHFKYRMSFDMASLEQAEYIEIDGANLLHTAGNALIKCPNDKVYEIESSFVSDKEIRKIVNELGKRR